MKKRIASIVAVLQIIAMTPAVAGSVKTTTAHVNKATVYLSGVQLTCTSEFQLSPGINELVFEGVSAGLDQNSLQATAKGNIVIVDVKFQTRYNEPVKKESTKLFDKAMKQANDSLVLLNFEIEELNDQLQGLLTEKNIILNNRIIKGETLRDSLPVFKDGVDYLRARLINISTESIRLKKNLHFKNEARQLLENRIVLIGRVHEGGEAPLQEAVNSIVVTAQADAATIVPVTISFFVNQAAWLPSYDLKANNNGTIDMTYKAELRQNTGMNWNNVALTLSTGNPSVSAQKPELSPFYLSFLQAYRDKYKDLSKKSSGLEYSLPGVANAKEEINLQNELSLPDFTTVNEGMIQTEYEIKLKYSIPNDDNMHVVAIHNKTLASNYAYSTVPKLDASAYLVAGITDWSDMNLLPGNARIYFDGNYIGKSFINPDAATDTLLLSLGRDRNILVSRKKVKDKTKERVLVDEKIISVTYEIAVRNNKSTAITLDVTDQIPLSSDPNIKVVPGDNDHATYHAETGELTWRLSLKPNESKKIRFAYDVKIPKDRLLSVR
ncbi:MAG: DUF4139 domain-containing protein [Bacteroidetes bacterium]|nr:DUF4139 domain-containing protein [Bacteroidota bacterium]